jgi:transposase
MIGAEGMRFLAWLDEPDPPAHRSERPEGHLVRRVGQRHDRCEPTADGADNAPGTVRFTTQEALAGNHAPSETPYDEDARSRHNRGLEGRGYTGHLSEPCDEAQVHLITQVNPPPANLAEATCPDTLDQALVAKGRAPGPHLADAGSIAAALLVQSEAPPGIRLVGPVRDSARWRHKVEGAYGWEQLALDWATHRADCPQGHRSASWSPFPHANGPHDLRVTCAKADGAGCPQRARCPRAKTQPRRLQLQPQPQQEAMDHMRADLESAEGRQLEAKRAGIDGTLSQGVRAFGRRRRRSIGLAQTHLQQVARATARNFDRLAAWFMPRPRAQTRVSRVAALVASGLHSPTVSLHVVHKGGRASPR